MTTNQRVYVETIIEHRSQSYWRPGADETHYGHVVAWMQGNGPYAIVCMDDGTFVSATLPNLTLAEA